MHLAQDAELVLHVVAHLVRDDVGLREIAGRAELCRELLVPGQVDVDGVVARAVEGTHGRLGLTARGADRAREDDELRVFVGPAHLREDGAPGVLGVREHHRAHVREPVLLGGGLERRAARRLDGGPACEQVRQHRGGVPAHQQHDDRDHDGAAAPDGHFPTRSARPAAVLDVRASSS